MTAGDFATFVKVNCSDTLYFPETRDGGPAAPAGDRALYRGVLPVSGASPSTKSSANRFTPSHSVYT